MMDEDEIARTDEASDKIKMQRVGCGLWVLQGVTGPGPICAGLVARVSARRQYVRWFKVAVHGEHVHVQVPWRHSPCSALCSTVARSSAAPVESRARS